MLRSEKAPQESNYLTYLGNATDSDLNKRIKHERVLTAKLGNILTNKQRKTIRDELHKLESKNLTRTERERAIAYLINLKRDLEKEQKYHSSAHHDQTYYGIKDTEHFLMKQLMINTNRF